MATAASKILLMGKVGQGKSTLGNFMVRSQVFDTNPGLASVTGEAKQQDFTYNGSSYCVIDTPGLCDAEEVLKDNDAVIEIAKGIKISFTDGKVGVDAILLVFSVAERFSNENAALLKTLDGFKNYWPYVIVVFTNADRVGLNDPEGWFQEVLQNQRTSLALQDLIQKVNNRYILINTEEDSLEYYRVKMDQIMSLVQQIQEAQGYKPYTSELFEQAAEEIRSNEELKKVQAQELHKSRQEIRTYRRQTQRLSQQVQSYRSQPAPVQVVQRTVYHNGGSSDDSCNIL